MTNINRPVSEINPTTQTDLVEDNNALKHEEVVKNGSFNRTRY